MTMQKSGHRREQTIVVNHHSEAAGFFNLPLPFVLHGKFHQGVFAFEL